MKIIQNVSIKSLFVCALVLLSASVFTACKETIDESAYATKTEDTMADFLDKEENGVTLIKQILERVRLGNSESASTIYSVLTARGHYTLFAPTDEAVKAYCQQLVGSDDPADLSYEQARLVAYSCVIDNGTNNAYETVDFPQVGSFLVPNLYDRLLACQLDNVNDVYIINGSSKVIKGDNEVSNGYVHIVDKVIAPSAENVAELIQVAGNTRIMGKLLSITGIDQILAEDRDVAYENNENLPQKRYWSSVAFASGNNNWDIPQKRYLGFTGFVETDDVFENEWGITPTYDATGNITNWDEVQGQLQTKAAAVYTDATSTDPTSKDNALYRFVAYHFLKGKMAYNQFVHHCTEHTYKYGTDILKPQDITYPVDVWDYYCTLEMGSDGRRGLIKVLQAADKTKNGDASDAHRIILNRVTKYEAPINVTNNGTYLELDDKRNRWTLGVGGDIRINELNVDATSGETYENNASNGYYYTIEHILTYDATIRHLMANERIRYDVTTMMPELISNNFRGNKYQAFMNGYFENCLHETEGTEIYYLQCGHVGVGYWHDYQGDEFLFSGVFDFVLRLPPVPEDGQYEIRMGAALNSLRGMCQIYFGEDPDNTLPVGLPFDMRQSTQYVSGVGAKNPEIPFILDSDLNYDETLIQENDKNLRIHGYMKAPAYFWDTTFKGQVREQGADALPALRRIITVVPHMEANKQYYLRFKSALEQTNTQFFVDYFEIVNNSVYNGAVAEDIW